MGKIVIPKNSASVEETMEAIRIYYEANDWLSNEDFIKRYRNEVGILCNDTDSSAYTKKGQIGAYYGFIEWADIKSKTSPRRITERGKVFYDHFKSSNTDALFEDIMCSLEEVTFGRNNYACPTSDTDVEPPALFLRAALDLGYLANDEFAYLVYKMSDCGELYTDALREIKRVREIPEERVQIPDEAQKYKDIKPIIILERWGVLTSDRIDSAKGTSITPAFLAKYRKRLMNLKVYNIDKNVLSEEEHAPAQGEESINAAWYVGATGNNAEGIYTDFSDQYIAESRWENLYSDKYIDIVKKMKVGDHIVIKAAYTKKNGLPFDNHGRVIGVMSIKAIGVITNNHGDGKNIDVNWERVVPIKEWFGDGLLRTTVHYVDGNASLIKKALLQFTFYNTPQDYSIFDDNDEEDVPVTEEEPAVKENKEVLPLFMPRTSYDAPFNTILYGAPGTGKTYSTVDYALSIIRKTKVDLSAKSFEQRTALMQAYREYMRVGRIVFTTFHQSYGYEDFIQGLRPYTDQGALSFAPADGVFKRICNVALNDPNNNYVIIIDEINRANISKVFGELITLIEPDKRWGEINGLSVTLPSGDVFAVPNNLYIIGTMNSADKSISLIDAALRRRFIFVEVIPNLDLIADRTLRTILERLNKGLATELESTDLLIGHAYFIGKKESDLCEIMNHSIIPLLYEYFYDNRKKVEDQIKRAIDGFAYEIVGSSMGRLKLIMKG